MRFLIRFAHRKYLEIIEGLAKDPTYELPVGVYRTISVVVDAPDADAALGEAFRELGWPDEEVHLVPIGMVSQVEIAGELQRTRNNNAILALWTREEVPLDLGDLCPDFPTLSRPDAVPGGAGSR